MRLTLNVLRCPDAAVPESRNSNGADISIGRGLDCDWVLQDPDRVLSKRHCVLEFRGGYWQVRDTSTNGTFLNSAAEPIGRDMVQPLSDGDRVRLGNYEIEARIAAEPAAAPWAGAAAPPPAWGEPAIGTTAGRGRPGADPFADPLGPPSGLGGAPLPGAAGGLPDDWDPMAEVGAPMPDHAPAASDAFLPPRAAPLPAGGAGGIPADWDPFADAPPASPSAAPAAARGDAAGLPAGLPADWDPLADFAAPGAPMPAPSGQASRQAPAASPPAPPAAPRRAASAPPPVAHPAAPALPPAAHQAAPVLPADPSAGLPAPASGVLPDAEPPEAAAPVPAAALPDGEDPFAEAGIPSRSIPDPGMPARAGPPEAPPPLHVATGSAPAAPPWTVPDASQAPPWAAPDASRTPPWAVPGAAPVTPAEGRGAAPPPPWTEAPPARPAAQPASPGAPAAPAAAAPASPYPGSGAASAAPPGAAPGPDAAAALAALLRGAGLSPAALHGAAQDPIALCEQAGAALHAAIAGIRALLIARADVKREFRIEQTMLRAAGNNPVKFAATDEAAIAALLAGGPRGTRSVTETVGDLTAHEVATLAATQAAARALLLKLAPEVVEASEPGGSGGLFGGSREKRLWDAYRRLHTRVVEQFEDDFDSAFGKEFARAYEQAVAAGGGDAEGRGRR